MAPSGKTQSKNSSFFQGSLSVYACFNFFLFDFLIFIDFYFQFPSNVLSGHADPCFYPHHDLKVKKWSS